MFIVKVVGESNYQDALEQICGGRSEDGANLTIKARLIHEDSNPYDNQAIRIDIKRRTVGYLDRKSARLYRKRLEEAGHAGRTAKCTALIVGGWDRGGGDRGHFGVRLDLPIG
jgi:hypothetical protein